ncbi:MAG: hypothetical protein BZ135_07130 [Methanosphaera sp. rholeuAM6]|nr:MAG: hypothetical protein BZ135_07130 [Methanosphaera sp. rholeuAM6]
MVYSIEEIKEKTIPIAKEYGLISLYLFGSYIKGVADEDSYIDLLYDGELTGLLQYSSLVRKLESILGCPVDLVSTNSNNKKLLHNIKKDGVLLYEKER